MAFAVGTRLGPYEVTGTVGAGGMGVVYRARDARLGRDVAVKVLPDALKADAQRLARFELEARTTSSLNHPNVMTVLDVGVHEGSPYLVAELLEGATLREKLRDGPVPLRKCLDWAAQIARGLAAAHASDIVHRDLKPENLFITTDGRVKILDFGIARALGPATAGATLSMTDAGAVLGTAGYMSPEQVRGQPADARSDLFALGTVVYEMLSGRLAFGGDTPVERGYAVLNKEPPDLSTEVPRAVEQVMRRCLEKVATERFDSAKALAYAFEALAESPSGGTGALPQSPPSARRWIAVALALFSLAAASATAFVAGRKASVPAVQSAPAVRLSSFTRRLTRGSGVETWPALAPDASWFVFARGEDGKFDVFRQRVGGDNPTNLTPDSPLDDTQPAISPDGNLIAFRSEREGGGIFLMGATGESVRRLTDFGYHPAWSPDGTSLAISTAQVLHTGLSGMASELYVVRKDTGEKRLVTGTGGRAYQPAWSPDGRWIAFHAVRSESFRRDLWIVAAENGEAQPFYVEGPSAFMPTWGADGRHVYFASAASGVMGIWRLGVAQGKPVGAPELVIGGVGQATLRPTLSRDGHSLLFLADRTTSNLVRIPFDPEHARLTGPPRALTVGTNGYNSASVSPDGEWVAFTTEGSYLETHEDLFVMRADGTALRRLTDDEARDRKPMFSYDSRRIVFQSNRSGAYDVWSISPDGSGLTQLTNTRQLMVPKPSPVDSRIAADGKNGWVLFEAGSGMDPKGLLALTPSGPGTEFSMVSWTADGSELVGSVFPVTDYAHVEIAAFSLSTGRYRKLFDGFYGVVPLRDGRRFLTADRVGALGVFDTTTGKHELLFPDGGPLENLSLPRDERWIYADAYSVDSDVWIAELPAE